MTTKSVTAAARAAEMRFAGRLRTASPRSTFSAPIASQARSAIVSSPTRMPAGAAPADAAGRAEARADLLPVEEQVDEEKQASCEEHLPAGAETTPVETHLHSLLGRRPGVRRIYSLGRKSSSPRIRSSW